MRRTITLIMLFFMVAFPMLQHGAERCVAQQKETVPDHDYKSLAITAILNVADEAAKLPAMDQRVFLLVYAARLLPTSKREDAIRLLNIALRDLKDWMADGEQGFSRSYLGFKLRSVVLAAYAKIDLEKAMALQKEAPTEEGASRDGVKGDITESLRQPGQWFEATSFQRGPADEAADIALAIIDINPERSAALIRQSVATGSYPFAVSEIFRKLNQAGERPLLEKLETEVGQLLAANATLDPMSLAFAASFASEDGMPPAARGGFVRFFMNSLERWSALVKGEGAGGGLDPGYIGSSFMIYTRVRPVVAKYSPEDLIRLDELFEQVSPFVPETMKSRLQGTARETALEPRDKLTNVLKDPNPEKRDTRLIGFVADLLREAEKTESQSTLDLAAEGVSNFSNRELKIVFADSVTIMRMNSFVKQQKFIDARRLADSISSEETRAWAMMALAVAAKDDRVLAFELTSNALKALDTASPSPARVELALNAVTLLAKDEPQRAFEALSTAAKYENSSPAKKEADSLDLGRAVQMDATIGKITRKLANGAESLSEVEIDPAVAVLASVDWFRSQYLANEFREPSLRLSLKLRFVEGILAAEARKAEAKKKEKRTGKL